MTYYLAGPVIFFHLVLTVIALFSRTFNQEFSSYIVHSIPFLIIFFIIQVYIKIFYFLKKKSKAGLGGYLFVYLGTWPVYTLAFILALFRIKIPFISTPKEHSKKGLIKLIIPQIATASILFAGIIYNFIFNAGFHSLIIIPFALILILIHSGVFYGVWENFKFRKKKLSVNALPVMSITKAELE